MSGVTLASWAIAVLVMRPSRTNAMSLVVMAASLLRLVDAGSGGCRQAVEPFVETDAAQPRLAQRHQRALLDTAAEVPRLAVPHDLARIADRLQIARDDVVERDPVRAGDLDDAVARRRDRHIGDGGGDVVRGDGLEQAGRDRDLVAVRAFSGDALEELHELGRADDGVGDAGGHDQLLL